MLPAAEVATSEAPFSLFVETYWGHGPAVWIAAFAAVSALGALTAWTLIQAEQPDPLAAQGLLPAWFARPTRPGTPAAPLLLSRAISTACLPLPTPTSTPQLSTSLSARSTTAPHYP